VGASSKRSQQEVMRIVCDTGPLMHLAEANASNLLHLAGELHIPQAVDIEMRRYDAGWTRGRFGRIQVTPLDSPYDLEAAAWRKAGLLDAGEAEAIQLTRQLHAQWLLTDDAAARLVAQSLGLETHGSLGVVLWAAAVGHLARAAAETALQGLEESSLWLSPAVLEEAKAALNELFLPGG
jgi:predicted nucleic acid-binding protein